MLENLRGSEQKHWAYANRMVSYPEGTDSPSRSKMRALLNS
jgi:hypothetical protein